jgi:hypothetical protein
VQPCVDSFELAAVDGVREKVLAIVEAGRFDTIVVAGDHNRRAAERVLRDAKAPDIMRVVNLNDGKT